MGDSLGQPYRAFLLRCWREGAPGHGQPLHWRFSLQEVPDTHKRHGFARLEDLLIFLEAEFSAPRVDGEAESGPQQPGP